MTPDQAEAALAKLGLSIGSLTVGGSGKPGTISGPEGLALAGQGSAIDLTVAPGGASTSLVFKVVTAPKFKPAPKKRIAARVTITKPARVTAQLFSPRRVKLYTWRFSVHAGRTIIRLRIPKQVKRPGIYTMRWSARAGRETVSRTIRIRIVGAKPPVQRVEIVLAGTAAKRCQREARQAEAEGRDRGRADVRRGGEPQSRRARGRRRRRRVRRSASCATCTPSSRR